MKYIDEDLDYIYVRVGKENKSVREMTMEEVCRWMASKIPSLSGRDIISETKLAMLEAYEDEFTPVMIKRDKRKEWKK